MLRLDSVRVVPPAEAFSATLVGLAFSIQVSTPSFSWNRVARSDSVPDTTPLTGLAMSEKVLPKTDPDTGDCCQAARVPSTCG